MLIFVQASKKTQSELIPYYQRLVQTTLNRTAGSWDAWQVKVFKFITEAELNNSEDQRKLQDGIDSMVK